MKKSIYVLIMALVVGIGAKVEGADRVCPDGAELNKFIMSATTAYTFAGNGVTYSSANNNAVQDGDVVIVSGACNWSALINGLPISVTVKADPSLSTRPIITYSNSGTASYFIKPKTTLTTTKSITFDGVDIVGTSSTPVSAIGFIGIAPTTTGANTKVIINNCVLRRFATSAYICSYTAITSGTPAPYDNFTITNSRIIGFGSLFSTTALTVNSSPANIELRNCYFGTYSNAVNFMSSFGTYFNVNHCTFNNVGNGTTKLIFNSQVSGSNTISNSVFANCVGTGANVITPTATGSGNINLSSTTNAVSGVPGTINTSPALMNGTLPTVTSLSTDDSWYYASSGTVGYYNAATITKSVTALSGFAYNEGSGPSVAQTFTVSGTDLFNNLTVAAPANYEVSSDGTTYASSLTFAPVLGVVTSKTISVRLVIGLTAGSKTGDITISSANVTSQTIALSGTVSAGGSPAFTTSVSTLSGFNYLYKDNSNASGQLSFTVSGSNLNADVAIAAPTNYEVSTTSGSGFGASASIPYGSGTLSAVPVYVRLKAGLNSGSYNAENIALTSTGATEQGVSCSGSVTPPTVSLTPTSLTSFFALTGSATPSTEKTFTVGGSNLAGNITVTPPTNYEISTTTGGAFAATNPITLSPSSGSVSSTTIYVRLKGSLATSSYSENITVATAGTTDASVACSGVVATPIVKVGTSAGADNKTSCPSVTYVYGAGPSANSATFMYVSGDYLQGNVTATAPTNFEVSTNSSTYADFVTYTMSNSTVSGSLYVRLKAGLNVGGSYGGDISLTSVSANLRQVTLVNCSVTAATPTVTVTPIGTYTYNGSAQGPNAATNTGTGTSYTFSYVGTGTTTYTASPIRPTELGTYTATATVAAHGNYAQASSSATAFNITTETVNTGGNLSAIPLTDPELANTNITVSSGELMIDATKTVRSITVNSGAQLTIATGQTLTLTSLTLKSDATGTSTYKPVGTGALVVTGTTNVEQYLTYTRNYYVSSPVSNAVAPAGYTYYGRNETLSNLGWVAVSVGAGLTAGKGYIALPGTGDAPITFTTQSGGTLNTGTIPVSLTYTPAATSGKGYNLIGNPYPSHLNWTKAFTDANVAKIEPSIWYRTKVGNGNTGGWSFKTYNAFTGDAVPLGTTGIIPPMQGFWVLAKQTTTIDFTDDMRSHETGNPLKAPAANNVDRKKVRLQVSNGTRADEALLVFDSNASDNYDSYDSPKMMNNATDIADIYTVADAKKLVINGMSNVKYDTEIPIGFSTGTAGDFSISANEFSNFDVGTRLILLDKNYPTIEPELTPETAYHFSAPVTTASTNRFSLIFRAPGFTTGLKNTEKLNAQVFVNAANQITIIASEKTNYSIFNALGQMIENGTVNVKHETQNAKLNAGVYVVKVNNALSKVIIK